MITITRDIFINIFQMEHISAVKFDMGYEKNMSLLVIPKSPKVWKKSWKNPTGFSNTEHLWFNNSQSQACIKGVLDKYNLV